MNHIILIIIIFNKVNIVLIYQKKHILEFKTLISSHKSISQNPIDFDDYIDNIDIQEENSKIK